MKILIKNFHHLFSIKKNKLHCIKNILFINDIFLLILNHMN